MKTYFWIILSLLSVTGFTQPVDTLAVYDHHCESANPYTIDTTIFSYQHDTLYIRNVKNEFCCPKKLLALLEHKNDTLVINVVNPVEADCTCECSYGYTVKIKMTQFDKLDLKINKERFTILKSDIDTYTSDIRSKNYKIFPNPVSGILNLNCNQPKRIEITDMYGKIKLIKIQDSQFVDLSDLKTGIYTITIFMDNYKWTEKIMKK